ncbi:MAG: hypothetical protein HY703_13060 [Gemmatimonadetes bacterium]|nr:hypothetical protein [Gemmatimonadota bacterium]
MTSREFWTVIHGLLLGSIYLLAFAGGFAGLWSLRKDLITERGLKERMRRLYIGVSMMAILSWATVITGTYIVYPWYRASTPTSPRSMLLADPETEQWHTFGMEWKEHVAWLAPILATAVAFIVITYGKDLAQRASLRKFTLALFCAAFAAAAIAGLFGAFINKVAPIV